MKFQIFLIALMLMPFCTAEVTTITPDRFQILMMQQENRINQHIDDKYKNWEEWTNGLVTDVKQTVDSEIDSITRRLVIGILASFLFGAIIVLLFVNWYLRKFYRTEWK